MGCDGARLCSAFASPGTSQTSGTDADIRSPSLHRTDPQREAHPDTPISSGHHWPCPAPVGELGGLAPDQKASARPGWGRKGEVVTEGEDDDRSW